MTGRPAASAAGLWNNKKISYPQASPAGQKAQYRRGLSTALSELLMFRKSKENQQLHGPEKSFSETRLPIQND